jgi:predicted nucleic acid-binding protein
MKSALADTTVLSNFAHAQRPDLLRALFASLLVPDSVWTELGRGERSDLIPKADWGWLGVVSLTPEELEASRRLQRKLDLGEADCLAIAQARSLIVYTDDRRARRLGRSLGLEISGTIGCLLDLVEQSIIDFQEADVLLARMRKRGYRSPVLSLTDAERLG